MATLSRHGKVQVRLSKIEETPESLDVVKRRHTVTYHSDGWILEKDDVWFKPNAMCPAIRQHTWGWKLKQRLTAPMERVRDFYLSRGYKIEAA